MDEFRDITNEINSLSSFKKRLDFVRYESGLEKIGGGSGRDVYILDDEHVLKVAKNYKGIHQNARESDMLFNEMYGDVIAKTKDFDDEFYLYTIAERGKDGPKSKVGLNKMLKEHHGIEDGDMEKIVRAFNDVTLKNINWKDKDKLIQKYEESDLILQLEDMAGNFDTLHGDLDRHSSWGFVKGNLVILDYGLNKDDYNHYYNKASKQKMDHYPMYGPNS